MRPGRFFSTLVVCLSLPGLAVAQGPALAPSPAPPIAPANALAIGPAEVMPADPLPLGQQHWVGLSLAGGQPSVATLQVTLFRYKGISYAAEAYSGSALFESMYGFGGRAIWTAWSDNDDDAILVKPGLGVHILPDRSFWGNGDYCPEDRQTVRCFAAADVDVSWLHEFAPHFAWEMGVKAGIAARVAGHFAEESPRIQRAVLFGNSAYPIISVFAGFRF